MVSPDVLATASVNPTTSPIGGLFFAIRPASLRNLSILVNRHRLTTPTHTRLRIFEQGCTGFPGKPSRLKGKTTPRPDEWHPLHHRLRPDLPSCAARTAPSGVVSPSGCRRYRRDVSETINALDVRTRAFTVLIAPQPRRQKDHQHCQSVSTLPTTKR